jgi:hypothetical protein
MYIDTLIPPQVNDSDILIYKLTPHSYLLSLLIPLIQVLVYQAH